MDGSIGFTDNLAGEDGGGASARKSQVHVNGNITFVNNSANRNGGGVRAENSTIGMNGSIHFIENSAGQDGGGVIVIACRVYMDGTIDFTNNSAVDVGGAMYAESSTVDLNGSFDASYNIAGSRGGAIFSASTELYCKGNMIFAFNTAVLGGAMAMQGSNITVMGNTERSVAPPGYAGSTHVPTGSVVFIRNTASDYGGAMHALACDSIQVNKAIFVWNTARFGGAVYVALAFGKTSQFSNCVFDENKGADGGAVYLYTGSGVDIFTSSVFRHNFAEVSGGAIFHTGSLFLSNTSLVANEAGVEGPALMSIGLLKELSNVSFLQNAYRCGARKYGHIIKNEVGLCKRCFDEVCSRCSTGGDDIKHSGLLQIDGLPVCSKAPPGTIVPPSGTTVETLVLEKGYYRTSNQSHIVLECYRTDACTGGIAIETTCAVGYMGPYCAVCTEGFSPGTAYSCHECSESTKQLTLGLLVLIGSAVLLLAAVLLWRLGTVGNARTAEGIVVAHSCWDEQRWACKNLSVKLIPLSAIKIVVTVWQIVYQFGVIAGQAYPEIYSTFIFKLAPVNLDMGLMLSYSCLVTFDFYHRLLIATIMPPAMLITLVGSCYIGMKRNSTSEIAISTVKHRHQSVALLLAFWVYSSVSYTIFQTFSCDDLDNGKAYLRADYSLECSTTRHRRFEVYSLVMVCLYPVGIPAVFAWCLARNRRDLCKADRDTLPHLESLNTLWAAYKPSRYYFELVECIRRVFITGIAAFVLPNSTTQISMVLLFAVAFVFISESIAPFETLSNANLYRWGNGVIVASLYVAFLLKVDLADESEQSIKAFSGVLIAANVVMIITVLVQTVLLVKQWGGVRDRVRQVDTPVRRAISL